MGLEEETQLLQDDFAMIDMLTQSKSGSRYDEFLVKKTQNIKIKMYQEQGHATPHVHIDYGHNTHTACYAIKDGNRLAGNLNKKYDQKVIEWININHEQLLLLWCSAQNGEEYETIIANLRG